MRCEDGRPAALLEEGTLREIVAVEGPERLSGEGWERPYRREYFRACTEEGELLWLFRTWRRRPDGGGRGRRSAGGEDGAEGDDDRDDPEEVWRLHGWWD